MAQKTIRRPVKSKKPKTRPRPQAVAASVVRPPKATVTELDLLRELSNAVAVSGDEGAVRRLVLEAIRDQVDETKVDALGNVLAIKKGTGRSGRVLVAAHMDEVG